MPVDPRVRQRRLSEDYEVVSRLRGDILDFDAFSPPAPDRYILRFKLRSLMGVRGGSPVYSPPGHVHTLELRLPTHYPDFLTYDDIRFLTQPIFHPNVFFPDGRICIRDYRPAESLAYFVLRLARMIQFDPVFGGEDNPANGEAARWYIANMALLPLDRQRLPDPDSFVPGEIKRGFYPGTIVKRGG